MSLWGPELQVTVLSLASAASWGAGDFSGGVAAKRSNVYAVVLISQMIGLLFLAGLALLLGEPIPSLGDMLWGGAVGIAGVMGLVALYHGLANGPMGIVAPIAAVTTAAVPAAFGMLIEGLPATLPLVGFGLAFVAVWFVSRSEGKTAVTGRLLRLPLVAGLGFGICLILIDQISDVAVLWPLAGARLVSVAILIVIVGQSGKGRMPAGKGLLTMALAGVFDAGGNVFYSLASHAGRLDVAAVLSSLYPAATVLLARFILKESISRQQWIGVLAALGAIALITS